MKPNGTPEVEDVPRLIDYGRQYRNPPALMQARAALLGACEDTIQRTGKENRAMTASERIAFDENAERARELSIELQLMTAPDSTSGKLHLVSQTF